MWATGWMCSAGDDTTVKHTGRRQPWCSKEGLLPQKDYWAVENYWRSLESVVILDVETQIEYCLSAGSEDTHAGCAIRYSSVLVLVVMGLNVLKLVCAWFLWRIHARTKQNRCEYEPLITQGDAIASLSLGDANTKHLPFMEASDCTSKQLPIPVAPCDRDLAITQNSSRLRRQVRWYRSISVTHWLATVAS
jgi:hypothetical protein